MRKGNDKEMTCITARELRRRYVYVVFTIVCIWLMAILMLVHKKKMELQKFTAPAFEEQAIRIDGEVDEESYQVLSIPGRYDVGMCGAPVAENGKVTVYFTNPTDNSAWLKLQILDKKGDVIGETGILKQGYCMKQVVINKVLQDGETPVTMEVMGYEPDTYYSVGKVSLETNIIK